MKKFVPYEKLSKKKRRELDSAKRTVWAMNPVTRKPENPKAYNRRKALREDSCPDAVLFNIWAEKSAPKQDASERMI